MGEGILDSLERSRLPVVRSPDRTDDTVTRCTVDGTQVNFGVQYLNWNSHTVILTPVDFSLHESKTQLQSESSLSYTLHYVIYIYVGKEKSSDDDPWPINITSHNIHTA